MKIRSAILLTTILVLLVGCAPTEKPVAPEPYPLETAPKTTPEQAETPEPETPVTEEPTIEEQTEPEPETTETQEEEPITEIEGDELQQAIKNAEIKIRSYQYRHKDPSGKQYDIFVKGNKMKIDYISKDNVIYLDTDKQTAEEYCIVHSRCGREWGKIADLDYHNTYILTPLDWLERITQSTKITDGFYYGKDGLKLDTDIGEITVDKSFGFIYSLKQDGKEYLFLDAVFNNVDDSDVNIPEHLLPD